MSMRVYQLIRVSGGRPTATSGHRTARRKRLDDLERIMRMVSSAIPIITFRYYPYKRKKLTFWVSLTPTGPIVMRIWRRVSMSSDKRSTPPNSQKTDLGLMPGKNSSMSYPQISKPLSTCKWKVLMSPCEKRKSGASFYTTPLYIFCCYYFLIIANISCILE